MTAAVQEVKKVGKGVLDNRYDEHRVVIERGYQAEQLKVAAANQNPPERRAAADAQMNLILARMKVSLDSMRSEKEALFKVSAAEE
jgi:hypothetical protein